ncbi:tetratricopeptide repeat protein [Mucilaginibacter terrae]|uniref:tetratricopeptide repeat protein n=1 Tax=Mucilaginibacter terrae TaxID=1955052 RepID=UPI00362531F8
MRVSIYIIVFLSMSGSLAAQNKIFRPVSGMIEAETRLNPKSPAYDPKKSVDLYIAEAQAGNKRAMNILGVLYSLGNGTPINGKEAVKWFSQAAKNGYSRSWFNLGLIYKQGLVVDQDFEKACKYFEQGSLKNQPSAYYGLGFMHYKGLGCAQSYPIAVSLFKRGASLGSMGAMYMLGLCYRNGYGLPANLDSARYWLSKAAKGGYDRANDELQVLTPENLSPKTAIRSEMNAIKKGVAMQASSQVSGVNYLPRSKDLTGKFTGTVFTYDWSGQHIVSQEKLVWEITGRDSLYRVKWKENEKTMLTFSLYQQDTVLNLEDNTGLIERTDHYSPIKPVGFELRRGSLTLQKKGDSILLAGPLQFWSVQRNEPEKPVFVSLVRPSEEKAADKAVVVNTNISRFKAWPNPFATSFEVSFEAKRSGVADMLLVDRMGNIVYRDRSIRVLAGINNVRVNTAPAMLGTYILSITSNGEHLSTTMIKQ